MLGWVSKLLSGKSLEVPGVSPKCVEALEKSLAPLESAKNPGSSALAKGALLYVLRGEPASVLAELSQNKPGRPRLSPQAATEQLRAQLYNELEHAPGAVVLRWALLLDAVLSGRANSMQFPAGIHWPEALMLHGSGRGVGYHSVGPSLPEHFTVRLFERALEEAGHASSSFVVS